MNCAREQTWGINFDQIPNHNDSVHFCRQDSVEPGDMPFIFKKSVEMTVCAYFMDTVKTNSVLVTDMLLRKTRSWELFRTGNFCAVVLPIPAGETSTTACPSMAQSLLSIKE